MLEDLSQCRPFEALVEDQLEFVDGKHLRQRVCVLAGRCHIDSGREQGVQGQSEGAVKHGRDDAGEEWTRKLQTGVGVCLYQVDLEALIDHEVVAEDLEGVVTPLGVDLSESRLEGVCHDGLR